MAYDRYDTRGTPRDERGRWSDDRYGGRGRSAERGSDQDRGFFERAGDEIASWFGDDDADRRRDRDRRMEERGGDRFGRDDERGRSMSREHDRDRDRGRDDRDQDGGFWGSSGYRGHSGGGGGGFSGGSRQGDRGRAPGFENGSRPMFGGYTAAESLGDDRPRDYRPMAGDYARSESLEERTRSGPMDPHYHSWRRRQMNDLDRDYDEYRRENQARFEDDFSNWRQKRGEKRGLLGKIREHMDVVGSDDEHVGTVDRVAGDRVILTKSDSESGGVHHSLSCSDIDRVEDNRVVLDCSSDQARQRWRDESRNRALFEREDQGEMGPRILDRSFEGTYR